jgi:hypothetical protein
MIMPALLSIATALNVWVFATTFRPLNLAVASLCFCSLLFRLAGGRHG